MALDALDLHQQGIIRRSGPFVKASTVATPTKARQLKPGSYLVPSCTVSSASNAKKKTRSRGKGRSALGQPPHPMPPPHKPAPQPGPVKDPVQFPARDIRIKLGLLRDNSSSSGNVHLGRRAPPPPRPSPLETPPGTGVRWDTVGATSPPVTQGVRPRTRTLFPSFGSPQASTFLHGDVQLAGGLGQLRPGHQGGKAASRPGQEVSRAGQ